MRHKHTPGPWRVCDGDECNDPECTNIYTSNDQYVFYGGSDEITWQQAKANAVLAAAAPELLDALINMHALVILGIAQTNNGTTLGPKSREALANAEAAIFKATSDGKS